MQETLFIRNIQTSTKKLVDSDNDVPICSQRPDEVSHAWLPSSSCVDAKIRMKLLSKTLRFQVADATC